MKKKKHKHTKKKATPHRSPGLEKGFDFAEQTRAMSVFDIEFNQALREAEVFGCAYGYDHPPGFPQPIPLLTLIGKSRTAFKRAFSHFANWGCENDGDAVEIRIVFKRDGSYEIWIGPEPQRSLFRLARQSDLWNPLMLQSFWIHPFDSTHNLLRKLKTYCKSSISPVSVSAAISTAHTATPSDIEPILGLPRLIKFDLDFVDEESDPYGRPAASMKEAARKLTSRTPDHMDPGDYCSRRRTTVGTALPVSRERIRRTGLSTAVRMQPGFEKVTETQVIQAALNLMLSNELEPGDKHYTRISNDLASKVWNHIYDRFEFADGSLPFELYEPQVLSHQIELDVLHVLKGAGLTHREATFASNQSLFLERGFVDD